MTEFTRLPKAVQPLHYVLNIEPNLETFKFSGSVQIDLAIEPGFDSKILRINCAEIAISSAELNGHSSSNISFDLENEEAHIEFAASSFSEDGSNTLKIAYTGDVNDKMKGLYRSKYNKADGSLAYIATTHFEPTGARLAFPCFDEPSFRSTFQINLVADKHLQTLSNMNEESVDESGDKKTVKYAVTPKMPTYLVAFIFGEFDYEEALTQKNIPVRVYTPLGQKEYGKLGAEFGAKCVDFYEDFFQIDYPLPKLDMIGIEDYPLGGMENWGLITYAMRCLIYNEKVDSKLQWQKILAIIAHEIAHQWFGNLVTIEWWSDLWLKEGFATFLQYYCAHKIIPEAKIWDVFMTLRHSNALQLDSLQSSHPIEVKVGHPRECSQVFDMISYAKGASLIRMLFHWMGEDNFRKGTQAYLRKYSYQSCETKQLWEAFEQQINSPEFPVQEVGRQWTAMKNFPIIKASIAGKMLTLKQTCCQNSSQRWQVPLNMTIGGEARKILFSQDTITIEVPENAVININSNASSFFRIEYDAELLGRLVADLPNLTSYDQMQLQSDVYYLVVTGKRPLSDYISLVLDNYSKIDLDYAVISEVCATFTKFSQVISKTGCGEGWRARQRSFFKSLFSRIGWTGEPSIDVELLRPLVLSKLANLGDQDVISHGAELYKTGDFKAQLSNVVYKCYLKHGGVEALANMIKEYKDTPIGDAGKRGYIRDAMFGQVSCGDTCSQVMEWIFSDALSKSERGWGLSILAARSGDNFDAYFSGVFMNRLAEIHKEYKETQFIFTAIIKGTIGHIADQAQLNRFVDYIEEHGIKEGHMAVNQSKDHALAKMKMVAEAEKSGLANFLKA